MAHPKLLKNELSNQTQKLALYRKLLPSLELKRQQLSAEQKSAERTCRDAVQKVETFEKNIGRELAMLGNEDIRIGQLVRVDQVAYGEENLLGVRLPVVSDMTFTIAPYSNLYTPAWLDVVVARLCEAARMYAELKVATERAELLHTAVRRATQRVNLFEKVLIPEAQNTIRRIKIHMGDLERSAVGIAKLAKSKAVKVHASAGGGAQ